VASGLQKRAASRSGDVLVSDAVMRSFLLISFIFYVGGLGSLFSPEVEAAPGSTPAGNPIMQVILMTTGLGSVLCILLSRRATEILVQSWPIYLLAFLALASIFWSAHRSLTLRRGISLLLTLAVGSAIGGRMESEEAIAFTVRAMVVVCILSIAWVIAFPTQGMHNDSDAMQSVHAGLWRGIFGHKVTMGYFSGLTFGLLVFYRSLIYRSRLMFLCALGASVACMLGSQSGNAATMAVCMPIMLFGAYAVALSRPQTRRLAVTLFTVCVIVVGIMIYTGTLAFLASYLGKSIDLTGRTLFWPVIYDYVTEHSPRLGFGYAAGMTSHVGPQIMETIGFYIGEAHNGFLESYVTFGYLGSPIVFITYCGLFISALTLVVRGGLARAKVTILPIAVIVCLLLTAYNESVLLMHQNIWTVLLSLAVAIMARERMRMASRVAVRASSPGRLNLPTIAHGA
jgi:exopolysaccharide production protein ExoQ